MKGRYYSRLPVIAIALALLVAAAVPASADCDEWWDMLGDAIEVARDACGSGSPQLCGDAIALVVSIWNDMQDNGCAY